MTSLYALCLTLSLLLVACPGGAPQSANHYLSGKVVDVETGAGVSGFSIEFSTYSAITTSGGGFQIDLGSAGGTVSGNLFLHGVNYLPIYASSISLDAGKDTQIMFYAYPASEVNSTHSVTLKVLNSGGVEIAPGTSTTYSILNSAGGITSTTTYYPYTTGGLVLSTPTFGSDCLVALTVMPAVFNVMARRVDLSATSTTVTLTQDSGALTKTVTVSGGAGGLSFLSPYGAFPGPSVSGANVSVTDPYGYGASWYQGQMVSDYLGSGLDKLVLAVANAPSIASTVTLPALSPSLGPNAIPVESSMSYSAGTLSIAAVSGVDLYGFLLFDNSANLTRGVLLSTSPSVTLPLWLQSQLATRAIVVTFLPMGLNVGLNISALKAVLDAAFVARGYGESPVADGLQYNVIPGPNFQKTITF